MRPRLTIINDQPNVLHALVAAFEQKPWFVRDYLRSVDACVGLRLHGADVIVLDWTNPPLHRIEFYRWLKATLPQAAIVYVSPWDDEISAALADEPRGPDEVIASPFSRALVVQRVGLIMSRPAGSREPA
jgi:DNA-binding response OmpR family regulator